MNGAPDVTTRPVPQQGAARHGRDTGADGTAPTATTYDDNTWTADPYADALRTGRGPLFLRRADGWLLLLEVERWCADPDAADLEVLRRCEGSVLDVGCGPGRLVVELGARGCPVLGIDVSEAAVSRTIGLGGQALQRSVFEPLPAEGRWGTVLLIDGNIGIGGDPVALLRRVAALLAPGGAALVELEPHAAASRAERVRLEYSRQVSEWIPWRFVSAGEIEPLAAAAALGLRELWCAEGRWFAELRLGETG